LSLRFVPPSPRPNQPTNQPTHYFTKYRKRLKLSSFRPPIRPPASSAVRPPSDRPRILVNATEPSAPSESAKCMPPPEFLQVSVKSAKCPDTSVPRCPTSMAEIPAGRPKVSPDHAPVRARKPARTPRKIAQVSATMPRAPTRKLPKCRTASPMPRAHKARHARIWPGRARN
jgi:hypothetical protein